MAGSYLMLQDHINALGANMEKGFGEIKDLLNKYEARLREMENREAGCQPIIANRMDGINLRISDHDGLFKVMRQEIQSIEKQVLELQSSNRLLKWFAGLVGSAVVIWLVSSLLALVR